MSHKSKVEDRLTLLEQAFFPSPEPHSCALCNDSATEDRIDEITEDLYAVADRVADLLRELHAG